MEPERTLKSVSVRLTGTTRQAYAMYCAAYDALGDLATAMETTGGRLNIPGEGRPTVGLQEATEKVFEAFFSLDEARATVDEALGILIDDGVDLPRFPERP